MGKLDESGFATAIAGGCAKCETKAFNVRSMIDREITVVLGRRGDEGRWTHDNAKFADGIYQISCLRCGELAFDSADCPRCDREGGIVDVVSEPSRLAVP